MKTDEAASRQRGNAAGHAAQRAKQAPVAERRCLMCQADISHRRRDAWHCGAAVHGTDMWNMRMYRRKIAATALRRPRCMICDKPLNPKLKGWTCSRPCAVKRHNWYVR